MVGQLDLVEPVVAADQDHDQAAVVDDDRHRLDQRARGHPEGAGDLLDRGQPGGRRLARGVERRGQLDRLGDRARDLDVGRVAGRERDLVLARRARRHVLVGTEPAHHPDVRLDRVPAQPAAIEDALVGGGLELVGAPEALLVAVERVGVLHRELARAEDPGARARLVPLLRLHLVEHQRQVAVGAHVAGHVGGDRLLVGHREDHVGALAVLELEQLVDVVAAGPAPDLGRLEHRHQHLVAADRVHLLAEDRLDLLHAAQPGRQPRPDPGAELADEPGADHQPMRDRLGVGRGVLERRQQVVGEAGHRGGRG